MFLIVPRTGGVNLFCSTKQQKKALFLKKARAWGWAARLPERYETAIVSTQRTVKGGNMALLVYMTAASADEAERIAGDLVESALRPA